MILNSIFLQAEINNASSMEAIQIDSNDIKRLNTAVTNILNEGMLVKVLQQDKELRFAWQKGFVLTVIKSFSLLFLLS